MSVLGRFRRGWRRWSNEEIAKRAVEVLRSRGVRDCEVDLEHFAVRGGGTTYFLGNAAVEVNAAWPWQRQRILERLIDLGESRANVADLDWAQARELLVPTVRDRFALQTLRYYDEIEQRPTRAVPSRVLTDRLCATLAIDLEASLVLVEDRLLGRWQVDFDEAFEIACRNLESRSKEPYESLVAGRVYQSVWRDGNASARLLLEEPLRGLELRGRPVFVAPSRDRLFVTGADDDDGVAALLRFVREQSPFAQPLSPVPVVRRWPGYESMRLPQSHPLSPMLQRHALRDWAEVYRAQGGLLEKLLRKRGEVLQLASFLVFEPQSPVGAPASFTTWEPGSATLLPRVERLALVDPGRGADREVVGMVDWSVADRVLGLEQRRTDDYPPRHRVEEFPAEATLRELLPQSDPAPGST